jgi:hypothetical protein
MNILVNGTSISRGNKSWPYYLQEKIGPHCNIVNLAQAGSGNTYIHESTVEEISQRKYDLVLIQWTYANRIDFRVKDINNFRDTTYTSDYQSQQNDWPNKIIYPINDQDYVQKNWIFGCGYINEQKNDSLGKVVKEYYAVTDVNEYVFSKLIKIISLQNTLKAQNIPYLFVPYRPITQLPRFENLNNMIDQSNIFNTSLYKLSTDHNAFFNSTDHPLPLIHESYAEHLYQELLTRELI